MKARPLVNLKATLDRLKQHGLRLKRSRRVFMADSVEYLGYRVDRTATEKKQAALQQAPRPKDYKQFRAFLGLVSYYGKFNPQLSTIEKPLNDLLKKEAKWQWTDQCEQAIVILQGKLASADVLVHYDPKRPLRLARDASAYGLGAMLSHVMPDGGERPIAYASKTLSEREVKYAQVEKGTYALKFGMSKFHQYLCGRKFTLITDHRPLTTMFGKKGSLPAIAAACLELWAIILSTYTFLILNTVRQKSMPMLTGFPVYRSTQNPLKMTLD